MKKRAISLLLVLVLVFSMLPKSAIALTMGDGTAENPYQIGNTVTNDGSAEPEGYTVENSYWARTEDVPATEILVCQTEEHDHVTDGCEAAYETAECLQEGHPTEGELISFTHADGTACTYDAENAKWLTNVASGYTCGAEAHTHTVEAGCKTVTAAYTVWTLSQKEETPPADNAAVTMELEAQAEDADTDLPIHFFLASPGNITNPNGSYVNYYGPAEWGLSTWEASYPVADIKTSGNWGQIFTQQGVRNVYEESTVTQYVASWPRGDAAAFKDFGSVRIGNTTYTDDEYEIKWVSIMCRNNDLNQVGLSCNQRNVKGEHIHIDGLLVEKIQPGEMEVYKTIPEALDVNTTFQFTLQKLLQPNLTSPPTSADAIDTSFAPMTLTASIPAGQTQAQIVGGSEISFGYYKLTEANSADWQNAGIALTDSRDRTQIVDTDTLYICIAPNGTVQYSTTVSGSYTVLNRVAVQNERRDVTVKYQWRVYNLDGTYSEDLPAGLGAHPRPADVTGVQVGSEFTYNTGFVQGTSYHDYENGLLYTFHGWDTYSNSSVFNTDPSAAGYTELDDGDADASNNKKIPITGNTWINGYWTVSQLPPADAYLLVHKDVVVASGDAGYVNDYLQNVGKMFLSIDPGIDKDGDGKAQIDVDFPGLVTEGGYRINVYQYAIPFEFTEHQAEVPGYTRTVDVTVSGNNLTLTTESGDHAGVTITEEYDPEQAPYYLGTVTYTNTYTKNIGETVTEFPSLTLVKRATDTGLLQADAVFTIYTDSNCTNPIAAVTTNAEGIAEIDFESLLEKMNGTDTVYLKETSAPAGYLVNEAVYSLTLVQTQKEELRNDEFVKVITYTLTIDIPEGSSASFAMSTAAENSYSLNVYNNPILGGVTVEKKSAGLDADDQELLEATLTVHGPIARNAQGEIISLGSAYTLILDADNAWTSVLDQLPIGEYLIHENMASVHGYTWDMNDVDYGTLKKEVYNNITSGVFEITANQTEVSVKVTNTYEKWDSADFYIYKTDPTGVQLSGAAFQLYSDEACTTKVTDTSITTSAVTGSNGYAWFSGFTVPADDADGIVTYFLRETAAPAGYYLSKTVYRVDIKAVTDVAGTTTFEPKISVKLNGQWVEAPDFSNTSDRLTIVNIPVKGQLTIVKNMVGAPADLNSVTLYVSGPNGYAKTVTLTRESGWKTTLTDLVLGEYTVIEETAEAPGYALVTTYRVDGEETTDKAAVVLKEANPGYTESNTVFVGTAEVTNTYTRREETIENPTSLTIRKVGEDGTTPLEGAVFTLVRDRDGETVSYTTNTKGEVTFSFLSGVIDNGEVIEGKYTLTETTAPAGYVASDTQWKITVKENDGQVTIKLNEDKNIFENIWDWIIGGITDGETDYSFDNNVLTVVNVELADMTISKTFEGATPPDGAVIEVAVFDSNSNLVQQVELSDSNNWTAKLEDLPADTYTVRENSPSLHGYTWTGAAFTVTGVESSDVTASGSSVQVKVADSADVKVEIKNAYNVWSSADFYVMKTMADGATPLAGAKFNLFDADGADVTNQYLHIDEDIHTNNGNETGSGGILHFHNFSVGNGQTAEFTLTESQAPSNYYSNTNTYKITVYHTDEGYDLAITDENGQALTVSKDMASFNGSNDVLTVINEEILADLVIKKTFPQSDLIPTSVTVDITGPNGYSKTVTLGSGNNYEVTLAGLSLGEYTIKEQAASQDGYALTVKYDGQILDQAVINLTKDHDSTAAIVNIQNTYLLDKHNPASFTVKKVDADTSLPLEGAVFGLYDSTGTLVGEAKTTNENGEVAFGPFAAAAEYTLKEISAPVNYDPTDATWTVTVKENDGQVEVKLNTDKNAFENIYDWIVDVVTGQTTASWKDGVLTVPNTIKTGKLTISKTVVDTEDHYAGAEYTLKLDASDDRFDQTITLKAGEEEIIEGIPFGTTYTLTEETTGAAFVSAIGNGYTGTIENDLNYADVLNTYKYVENNPGLNLLKVDADTAQPIEGVTFHVYYDEACTNYMNGGTTDADGKVNIPFHYYDYHTYYLKENAPAEGYYPNDTVYVVKAETKYVVHNAGTADAYTEKQQILTVQGLDDPAVDASNEIKYTYTVENTAIKPVVISVEKVWEDGGYHARPEEITVTLYRDGQEYDNAALNQDNNWSHAWSGEEYTDEYIWTVDEKVDNVPAEYTKNVTNEGNSWTITNTRTPKPVEITVTKAWKHNGGKDLPETINVTLYKDGSPYETVELSDENDWTYTWSDLTDVSVWRVDETDIPAGYEKKIEVDGYKFKITNTRIINPVEIHVNKVWVASEGVAHPESIEAVLYRDGDKYDTVKLSEKNDWAYTWTDLTDEYTWTVDEKEVPAGYTKNVTNNGYDFTITNTKDFKYVDVSVKKIWNGAGVTHPTSVEVTVYRDGVAYDTVTLSAANNWKYTWEDLTDEFEWEVDEPSVPSGYNKTVRVYNTYDYYISNTHEDNPKTGDFTDLLGLSMLGMAGIVGFCFTAFLLFVPRKKGKYEQ